MKSFLFLGLIVAMTVAPIAAQAPASKDEQDLLALVKDVQAQQAEIADNQTKIEQTLAGIAETIRLSRIFAKRSGGAHVPPPP